MPLTKKQLEETKLCECGCGQTVLRYRPKFDSRGHSNGYYERKVINGHGRKNRPSSKEHIEKIAQAQRGQKRGTAWNKGKSNWWAKGELNNKWKGGITPENTKLRNSILTVEWREAVYRLFDYTCQMCEAKSGNGKKITLNAHHIKTWSEYPDLRWDISNGICLCKECHDQTKGREKEFEKLFIALIENRKNSGEFLTDDAEDNPEPSPLNSIKVDGKVQRLIAEELTNKANTSIRHESDDIVCPA